MPLPQLKCGDRVLAFSVAHISNPIVRSRYRLATADSLKVAQETRLALSLIGFVVDRSVTGLKGVRMNVSLALKRWRKARTYPEDEITPVFVSIRECLRGGLGGFHLSCGAVETRDDLREEMEIRGITLVLYHIYSKSRERLFTRASSDDLPRSQCTISWLGCTLDLYENGPVRTDMRGVGVRDSPNHFIP